MCVCPGEQERSLGLERLKGRQCDCKQRSGGRMVSKDDLGKGQWP